MASNNEQVFHLRWALEFLETYDTVLLLLLAQLHVRIQSIYLNNPHTTTYDNANMCALGRKDLADALPRNTSFACTIMPTDQLR